VQGAANACAAIKVDAPGPASPRRTRPYPLTCRQSPTLRYGMARLCSEPYRGTGCLACGRC